MSGAEKTDNGNFNNYEYTKKRIAESPLRKLNSKSSSTTSFEDNASERERSDYVTR